MPIADQTLDGQPELREEATFAEILNNAGIGAAMFNSRLELVSCNDLFRHSGHFPEDLCRQGVPLELILRHEATNSQLEPAVTGDDFVDSWLRRARQRKRTSEALTRNDSRIFDTALAPVQTGGVVLTFNDITEQKLAELATRNIHEWHELVSEAASEGLYDWDISANTLTVSYRLTGMLGLDPGDLQSEDWAKLVHPDDAAAYREMLTAHFRGETPYLKVEYRMRRKSGEYIWLSDSGKCVRNASGRAVRLVGAVADVTSRRLTEATLRASEERYALAMEAIDEGIYDWNIQNDEIYFSSGVRSALGLDPRQLKDPRDWFARIHPDDQPHYRAMLIRHFKGETERFECEMRYQSGDGSWRYARQHGVARFNDRGEAVRMVGSTGDISDAVRQRADAERARDQLEKAIDGISDGFAIYDPEDRLVLCNDQYQALYPDIADVLVPGVTFEQVLRALAERHTLLGIGEDVDAWVKYRLELRASGSGSYQTELANGSWVNVTWRRARDGSLVGVFSDITALKQADISLRQSEERYALATAAATEGLYDWDVLKDRLMVSDRLNRIISLTTGELTSAQWNERVHPRDRDRYRKAMLSHFKGESEYLECEYRIRDGMGDHIWVTDSASSIRDERGRVVRLVGAITDISDRKKAEQDLRDAMQRADHASQIATEKAQALEVLSSKLSKYLSPQVYSSIFAGRQNVTVDAKRKKLSIFFSDIAGFTSVVDTLESEEITSMLNDYLSAMAEIALQAGGTIDKFIGDAILAFFGDPESKGPKEDAIACVRMAIAMQRRLKELQAKWRDLGIQETFELRIGITTGFCTVGNFGSEDRMDYTVVGNEVNAAARLQGYAETGGILISSETYALVSDEIHAEDMGQVTLKGLSRPVHAYKVLGVYDDLEEAGDLIRVNHPGLRLLFSLSALTENHRQQARESLEEALRRLDTGS